MKLKLKDILIDLIKEYLVLIKSKQNLNLENYTIQQLKNVCFIYGLNIDDLKDIETIAI
jgi:hypothetical protein